MAIPGTAANLSGGELSGTEFGQRLSISQQEQFAASPDLYDKSINTQPLEVYMHYAAIERKREAEDPRPIPDASWTIMYKYMTFQKHKIEWGDDPNPVLAGEDSIIDSQGVGKTSGSDYEKHPHSGGEKVGGLDHRGSISMVTPEEHDRAYRALRVASWQAVFYLITTDILGFANASQSFADLGYGPGVLVYLFFYLLAVGAGQIIWRLYLVLDSSKYPVVCYADLGERTFGRFVRHVFNILQSLQLVFNVCLLINGNATTLAQLINFKVCAIIWFILGIVGGQIRSLRNFAWFANCNIWLNIATMIMTLYGVSHYAPVPALSQHKTLAPIITSGWVPSYTQGWYAQVSGVQLAVFAYGGAMIFPEFMAEMRRPNDFWKAILFAQLFCFLCYMTFGIVNYHYQGQFASILPALDFDNTKLVLANNIIALITTQVAALLYGNIGVKVFYENVLRAYCKAPSMLTKRGRALFGSTVFVYWGVAWVIAVGIPSLSALVTLVGAAFILQFTYTFPPLLLLGHWMQLDAMKADNPWMPGMAPGSNRIDTWKDVSRWKRGFSKYWYAKVILGLMFLAAVANSALGIYAGVETAITSFGAGFGKPFSCTAPNA